MTTEPTSRHSSFGFAIHTFPFSRHLLTFADRIVSCHRLKHLSRVLGPSRTYPQFLSLLSFRLERRQPSTSQSRSMIPSYILSAQARLLILLRQNKNDIEA
jgi:hypothetical protein